ncbi:MAG: hypothetical protein ISS87_00595 [Candidatus Pacebacteria bacterium]|nr:hypothetical protein [Candidatus Paceibacterota bacterium]
MNNKNKQLNKKILLILLLVFGFLIISPCSARELELTYPDIPGAIRPVSTKAFLPETIIYLFSLSIRIAGLIAFGSVLFAGFAYITSAGDPNKQKGATGRIFNSFLGLGMILGSFLLLNTINPQLLKLGIAKQMTTQGIILFKTWADCNEFKMDMTKYDELARDNQAMKITSNISHLRGFLGDDYNDGEIGAVYSFENQEDLEIQSFNQENWIDGPVIQSVGPDDCVLGYSFAIAKSIKLAPKPPGVYLCCGGTYDANWTCQGKERYLSNSTASLPPECHDKVQGVKTKPLKEYMGEYLTSNYNQYNLETGLRVDCWGRGGWNVGIDPKIKNGQDYFDIYCLYAFSAILHNNANYKAECEVFTDGITDLDHAFVIGKNKASSVTVFRPMHQGPAEGQGVALYEEPSFVTPAAGALGPYGPEKELDAPNANVIGITDPKKVQSLEMSPDKKYIAILFEDLDFKGKCEVFTESDPDFVNNDIGRTGCIPLVGCHPNVESLKIYPTR